MPHATPAGAAADRNLLFGILAVQMDFVSRDALIAAMNAWVLAKHRPLGELLQEQGALTPENRELLDKMTAAHVKAHGDDPQRSLAAVAHPSTLGDVAQSVADPDLQASVTAAGATLVTTADRRPAEDGLRYRILRPHAQGGLGLVSVALDAELGREVAFKEIRAGLAEDPTLRGRFVREAEITGGLEHPGVVPVYGLGRYADGRPYYAMRLIRGESLQEALRKLHAGEAGYTLRGLLARFVAACNAVAYAHSRGVIHRDLKPANVMLGPYGETLVVDWGLAKVVGREIADANFAVELTLQPPSGEGSLTQAGLALGTPAFMSPEQARGEVAGLSFATDVYSLGATLYALLTGRPPVRGRDTAEVLAKVRQGEWQRPRQVKSSVPQALNAVCCKAMALASPERYASPLALAADVERWLADEPVTAYRESWPVRAGRWVRRHSTPVAGMAAAVVVTAMLGGAGLAWWQQDRARRVAGAEAAFKRATELRARASWSEARAALEQAQALLGESGPGGLRDRLAAARRALDLADQLDRVRLKRTSHAAYAIGHVKEESDRAYEEVFTTVGPGGPDDDPDAVGRRVASSELREALVSALDDWALVAQGERRAWALAVARRADPDPWRDRLRDPVVWDEDWRLKQLVSEVPPSAVTPSLAAAVSRQLPNVVEAESLLRSVQTLHPDEFWLNLLLGWALVVRGKPAEGEGFQRAALALRPTNPVAWNDLGCSLEQQGKLVEATTFFRRAIELDGEFMQPRGNLARTLEALGRPAEAATVHEHTLKVQKARLGPLDPETLVVMSNLARCYGELGRHDEALKLREETLLLRRAQLGPAHPDTLTSMSDLANCCRALGRYAEAVKLDKQTLALRQAKLGTDHPDTLASMNNLAVGYAESGRLAEALGLFREALPLCETKLGLNHPYTQGCIYNVACCHARLATEGAERGKDADLAMEWLKKAVAAGFKNIAQIKRDSDLGALRGRDDFKRLLAELEAKAAKDKK
jgi:tetratricopeptide (TPR) repeat protein